MEQIQFIIEIDKLKRISRKTKPIGSDRYENDAEHTWHLAMMAVTFAEYANDPELDLLKTLRMLLIHDIVEIDAGDTFTYDLQAHNDKAEREEKAALRIFGLLPKDQMENYLALWREFEARETAEARYANAIDRLQPMLLNVHNHGQSWNENGIVAEQVFAKNLQAAEGSRMLWAAMEEMLHEAVARGDLKSGVKQG
jgi:putative hydrolase of HD superfamily